MSEEQRRALQQQLWNIANTLRGKMNPDEFRDYILGLIFYKYLSERMETFADDILEADGFGFSSINEATADGQAVIDQIKGFSVGALGYFLKPSELFHSIAQRGSEGSTFILGDLTRILKNIEQSTLGSESAEDFNNLFEDMDLSSSKLGDTEKEKNDLVVRVLVHLDAINFNLSDTEADVLGDAYEYLIGQFASGAGKKAGEFYTPQPVSTLLSKIVTAGKAKLRSAYDPTCGSGSLLLRVQREAKVDRIFGQEMNRTTYNLARMNMIMHGVHFDNFDIKRGDTLESPKHLGQKFDAIVANPPFSVQWGANPLYMQDDRFAPYGSLAPSSKADFAFIQHMVHHLADDGVMTVVLPHGVLFRGASEGRIRQHLIEKMNCLDAVIGLPANIFFGTTIPTCVLVFKKCRKNADNVLFIDASELSDKEKTQNVMRAHHIEAILKAYTERVTQDKFCNLVSLATVAENDFNLNIPRYVDSSVKEDSIDLDAIAAKLVALEAESKETEKIIAGFCQELGIATPFSI
jgi:type I restriction enzyme M protein